MRGILLIVAGLTLMGLLGWITLARNGDRTTVSIETRAIERDVEKTREAVEETARHGIEKLNKPWPTHPSRP